VPLDLQLSVPPGATVIVAARDRRTGTMSSYGDPAAAIPTASLVKLLIALQVWDSSAPERRTDDRALIERMLRVSDDDAANELWDSYGETAIVTTTAERLGLAGTHPPERRGMWGWTTMSAADLVATMEHLLDLPDAAERSALVGALRRAEPLGADGYDQSFGLFRAGDRAVPVKQGWMVTPDRRRHLHSVAVIGDRYVVALLTSTAPGADDAASRQLVDGAAAALLAALPFTD
jgi:Beta-lactamase enzyme family